MRKAPNWILPFVLLAVALPLRAQYGDEGGYHDDEIQQSVARIAYVTGQVSYNRGDDPDSWDAAALNFPMTLGDRIWSARDGRAELQARGAALFLSSETELAALNLTEDVQQYSLTAGTLSVRLHRLGPDDVFEIDTPNAAVTFDRAGDYRIDVDRDGNTRVLVRRGRALVAAGGGQVPLEVGDLMTVDGLDRPSYDIFAATRPDGWDRWVDNRARRYRTGRWSSAVNVDVIGYQDLDAYGTWGSLPDYGYCWSPASVSAGWTPYSVGRWMWQDPWGWSWVSAEPWGFAPFHYGRWVSLRSRWWWVPTAPRVRVSYAPALVAFVGGSGWSASFSVGGGSGYVGWFPLAPADPLIPWWGSRRRYEGRDVRYVNRSYVTVVQQNVFVSSNFVSRSIVRDAGVMRNIVEAPIVRGALPFVPTRDSIRVSVDGREGRAIRPPTPIVGRSVVTRLAPPPAPPTFQAKVDVIRENRGAPVNPVVASRLSVERHDGARAIVPVRPVAQDRVVLEPRRAESRVARPVAVTAPSGKVLATQDRPFVGAPAAVSGRGESAAPRPAPGAVITREPGPAGRVESPRPDMRDEVGRGRSEQAPGRVERQAPAPTPVPRVIEREAPPVRDEVGRGRSEQAPGRVERQAPAPTPVPRVIEREAPPVREDVGRGRSEQAPGRVERQAPAPTPVPRVIEREAPPVRDEVGRGRSEQAPGRFERQAPPPTPVPRVIQPEGPPVRAIERPAPPPRPESVERPAREERGRGAPPPRVERQAPPREERKGPPPTKSPQQLKEEEKERRDKRNEG